MERPIIIYLIQKNALGFPGNDYSNLTLQLLLNTPTEGRRVQCGRVPQRSEERRS